MSGLRQRTHLVWLQGKPGAGRLFRGDADPVLIVSAHAPDIIGRKHALADKNWILAKAPQGKKRVHPYQKPPEVYILGRYRDAPAGRHAAGAVRAHTLSIGAGSARYRA